MEEKIWFEFENLKNVVRYIIIMYVLWNCFPSLLLEGEI